MEGHGMTKVFIIGNDGWYRVFRYRHEAEKWLAGYKEFRKEYDEYAARLKNNMYLTTSEYLSQLWSYHVPGEYRNVHKSFNQELTIHVGEMT